MWYDYFSNLSNQLQDILDEMFGEELLPEHLIINTENITLIIDENYWQNIRKSYFVLEKMFCELGKAVDTIDSLDHLNLVRSWITEYKSQLIQKIEEEVTANNVTNSNRTMVSTRLRTCFDLSILYDEMIASLDNKKKEIKEKMNLSTDTTFKSILDKTNYEAFYNALIYYNLIEGRITTDISKETNPEYLLLEKILFDFEINSLNDKRIKWKQSIPLFIGLFIGYENKEIEGHTGKSFKGILIIDKKTHYQKKIMNCFEFENRKVDEKMISKKICDIKDQYKIQKLSIVYNILDGLGYNV